MRHLVRNAASMRKTRRPLTVTYLIPNVRALTGGNQTFLGQADALHRRGHPVTILSRTPRPEWFSSPVRIVCVPRSHALAPYVPTSDVVISTHFTNTHELLGVRAPVKIYCARGDQYVFADPALGTSAVTQSLRELSRRSYAYPGIRFVPNSRHLAEVVAQQAGRAADALLPVCVDQTIFRPLPRPLRGSIVRVLIVGPDVPGGAIEPLAFKGMQDIRAALALCWHRRAEFTVVRMASTPPEIFADVPCEYYLAPDPQMKTVLYGLADILIYASHFDSCPRPPLEAMAAGCAVICTRTPGALEYCRDGDNCLLVPVQSPPALAQALERLLADHDLRARLAAGGLGTARQYPREREWDALESLLGRFGADAQRDRAQGDVRR